MMSKTFTRFSERVGYRRWGPTSVLALVCYLFAIGNTNAQYCEPVVSFCDEYIANVQHGTTSNPTGCTPGGFNDYTGTTFNVQAGSCQTIVVTVGNLFGGDNLSVFVDWNNDFDFNDPGETVYTESNVGVTVNAQFTVPTVAPGSYRIRFRLNYITGLGDPCASSSFGEVEDYTLEVGAASSCAGAGALTQGAFGFTDASISWDGSATALSYNVRYRLVSDPTSTPTWANPLNQTSNDINLTGLDSCGSYVIEVQSVCAGGDTSSWSCAFFFGTLCCFDYTVGATAFESEQCGLENNGGCLTNGNTDPIACGDVVGGTAWYDGNWTYDSDWYTFTVTQDTFVNIVLEAAFLGSVNVYNSANGCWSTAVATGFMSSNCGTAQINANLPPGTYWIVVEPQWNWGTPIECGGGNTGYQLSINCDAPQPIYCTPFVSACDEYIANVSMNGVDNPSGCTPGGYNDYTNIAFTAEAGSCQTMIVTVGNLFSGDNISIFVDWNQDYDFSDPGETVYTEANVSNTVMAQFTIPAVAPGDYRIRVRLNYFGGLGDPCANSFYGEVEDYTLTVSAGSACQGVGALSHDLQGFSTATISWEESPTAVSYNVRYKLVNDPATVPTWSNPVSVSAGTNEIALADLDTCGTYMIEVQSICGLDSSSYSCTFFFATLCCFDYTAGATTFENEACGSDINGGCFTGTGNEPIACGDVVAGTAWYNGQYSYDYDWYEFTVTQDTFVNAVLQSSFLGQLFLYNAANGCWSTPVAQASTPNDCGIAQINVNLAPGTYWLMVQPQFNWGIPVDCNGGNTGYQLTMNCDEPQPIYCTPSVAICDEYIANVELAGTSNPTGCTPGGYNDYTNIAFEAEAGSCVNMTVTIGNLFFGDDLNVFIDWNQDYDFNDPGETVFGQTEIGSIVNVPLSIPGNIAPGDYRIRVRLYYTTGYGDPCASTTFGEVEDYTLTVLPGGSCTGIGNFTIDSQSLDAATLSWIASPTAESYNVRFRPVGSPAWSTPMNTTDVFFAITALDTCTAYEIQVQVVCAGGDTSAYSCEFFFSTVCCIDPIPMANYIEAEACGDNSNDGCNVTPNGFETIACGDNIAGTAWWNGSNRDTDWYLLTLPQDSNVTVTLTAAFQSALFIINAAPGCASVTPTYVANSTTECETTSISANLPAGDWWVFVAPQFVFGTTYECGGGQTNYLLSLECNAWLPSPPNDTCGGAIEVFCGDVITGNTTTATLDNAPFCGTTPDAPGLWYTIVGDNSLVTLSLCNGSNYDTKLNVYTGSCGTFTCVTGNDDFCGLQSQVSFTAVQGETYYILVNGWFGAMGNFTMTVQCDTPPANDFVCGAFDLAFGSNGPYNTAVAGTEPGEPAPPATGCQMTNGWCNNIISNTLWFTFVAPASGNVTIQSPGFDTQLAVWDADSCQGILNGSAILVGANDDDPDYIAHGGQLFSSYLSLSCLTPGKTYFVQLDPYSSPGSSTTIILNDPGVSASDPSFSGLNATYSCQTTGPVTLTPVTPGGVFSGPGVTGSQFDPSAVGVGGPYAIVYTLNACTADTQYVTISELSLLLDVTNPSCGGTDGSIDLTVVDGVAPFSYTWMPGFSADEDLFGLAAGTYTVTVVDATGCSGTTSATLTAGDLQILADVMDVTGCPGNANGAIYLEINTSGTYTVAWSNGANTDSLTNLVAGIYSVTVTEPGGCEFTDTYIVSEPGDITLSFNVLSEVNCAGTTTGSVSVSPMGGTPPYTFAWSNGQAGATATNLGAATHSVTVTDAAGCTVVDQVTLVALSPAIVLTETHTNAIGGPVGSIDLTVSGGTAPFVYAWSNGANTQDISGLAAGVYTVTVTDANNCSASLSVTITAASPMNVQLTPTGPLVSCHMAFNVTLTATSYPNTTYTFRRGTLGQGAPVVQTGPSNTFQPNTPGTHNYVVIATDNATGMSDTSNYVSVTLHALPVPVVIAGNCENGQVGLTGTPTNPSYTYQWIKDLSPIAGATSPTYVATGVGAYRFQVTDSCGVVKISQPVWFPENCFVTGIEDIMLNAFGAGLHLYPNPNDGQFTVETFIDGAGHEQVRLEVYNVLGQMVQLQNVQLVNGYAKTQLNITNGYADGMYTVRVVSSRGEASRSVIVTR